MNYNHTGSWTGDPTNHGKFQIAKPAFGLLGNSLQVAANSLNPPVFPLAGWWNESVIKRQYANPDSFLSKVRGEFPRLDVRAIEIQNEEYAGLGIGVALILFVAGAFALIPRSRALRKSRERWDLVLVRWSVVAGGLIALLVFLTKFGNESGPRLLLPFYATVLFFLFSIPQLSEIASRRWFRVFAGLALLTIIPSVLITPSRPLIPPSTLVQLARWAALPPALIDRMATVYEVYGLRNDTLKSVRYGLPPAESEIGWIAGGNDPENSLWIPFGSRRIVPIITTPKGEIVSGKVPRFCVVSQYLLDWFGFKDPEIWAKKYGFRIISAHQVMLTVNRGKELYYVMERTAQ